MRALGLMLALVGATSAAPPPEKKEAVDAKAFQVFNQAELVFTGKVARVLRGPVTYTDPPGFHETLIFDRIEVLRLGARVAQFQAREATLEQLVAAMTGALTQDQTA